MLTLEITLRDGAEHTMHIRGDITTEEAPFCFAQVQSVRCVEDPGRDVRSLLWENLRMFGDSDCALLPVGNARHGLGNVVRSDERGAHVMVFDEDPPAAWTASFFGVDGHVLAMYALGVGDHFLAVPKVARVTVAWGPAAWGPAGQHHVAEFCAMPKRTVTVASVGVGQA